MRKIGRLISVLLLLTFALSAFSSCSENDDLAIMKIGDHVVGYDEYRYFYMNFRKEHETAGDTDYSEKIQSEIEAALREKYAVDVYAKNAGVSLDKDDMEAVKADTEEYVAQLGEKGMSGAYLTEGLILDFMTNMALEDKLRNYEYNEYTGSIISDDASVEKYVKEKFYRAEQILIKNDKVENYQLAKDVYQLLSDGTDFSQLKKEYSQDAEEDYCFVSGQLVAAFENAVKNLEIDEISNLVASEVGYHIIRRLPIDDDYINEHFEQLRLTYKVAVFNDKVSQIASEFKITHTGYYDNITDAVLVSGEKPSKAK